MTSQKGKCIKICRCQNYDLMFFFWGGYLVYNYSVEIFLGENGVFISKGSSYHASVFKLFPKVFCPHLSENAHHFQIPTFSQSTPKCCFQMYPMSSKSSVFAGQNGISVWTKVQNIEEKMCIRMYPD